MAHSELGINVLHTTFVTDCLIDGNTNGKYDSNSGLQGSSIAIK